VKVVDAPDPEGDGVRIKVAAVGICASDLIYLRHGSQEIAGHEFAGVTEDGVPVAVEAIFGCGACEQCEQGSYNMCDTTTMNVLGMTIPGGMSEYFVAPRHVVVPLPEGLAVEDASLVEPASVAWHACHIGQVGPEHRVAIVGGGAIGMLAGASAQVMGAGEVAIDVRHPHQAAARERLGAVTPVGQYDVVLETGGTESSLHRSVELARPGGTVVFIGVYDEITWPHFEAFKKEVRIAPALGYCRHGEQREFQEVAQMLAVRPDLRDMLITHRFPLEDAEEAYRVAADKSKGVFRVVVHP
jgi:2-desacetyl-2-hydroxyethyl bacteriochlorophyllide A dehydrogenase